jgi:hypothetical protein
MEIDGQYVAKWLVSANESERNLVLGSTFSDDYEWRIEQCDAALLVLREYPFTPQDRLVPRHVSTLNDGTFFFEEIVGLKIQHLINQSLLPHETELVQARDYLRARDFMLSEMGGNANVLKMCAAIRSWDEERSIPEGQAIADVYEIFKLSNSLGRIGARYLSDWLDQKERRTDSFEYDAWGRIRLAKLLRNTGQLNRAITATDVVELPYNHFPFSGLVMAILCTVRAATFLDLADNAHSMDKKKDFTRRARLSANKANANSQGDNLYIREVYQRINHIEI